jgi:hypothetical protein
LECTAAEETGTFRLFQSRAFHYLEPMRVRWSLLILIAAILVDGAAKLCAQQIGKGIEVREYQGWRNSVYINATETAAQAVIVPSIGGRLVHFSRGEENILFENAASLGKTIESSVAQTRSLFPDSRTEDSHPLSVPRWYGGYQCELGPLLRHLPEDTDYSCGQQIREVSRNFTVRTYSTNDKPYGVVVEKEFTLAPDTGDLGILQRVKNTSEKPQSYSLRDRTACKNGGFILIPLNKRSRFEKGWAYWYKNQGQWVCDENPPNVVQAQVLEGVLVIEAQGTPTTIGADSDAGWIAYAKDKLLFVKYFPHDTSGHYSDNANTVLISFEQRTMEFGPISPEFNLAPGETATFPEQWSLQELKNKITSAEQARKLVKKITPSPFATAAKPQPGFHFGK